MLGLFSFKYTLLDANCGAEAIGTVQLQVIDADVITLCNSEQQVGGCHVLKEIEDYMNNDIATLDREGNIVDVARSYLNDYLISALVSDCQQPCYFDLHLGTKTVGTSTGRVQGGTIRGAITLVKR